MKHIFIINPAAGKGVAQKGLEAQIESAAADCGADYEIYKTTDVGDAELYVRAFCKRSNGEAVRFYACGGDGTMNEVFNGAAGFPFAEVAVVPVGTGNDFVKNFGNAESFLDIPAQMRGKAIAIDSMKIGDRYAVNMINMGFDCSVVETVAKIKRHPFITSGLAYIIGVVIEFAKMPVVKMKNLVIDGKKIDRDELQLCAFAGGGFYGGGFHNAPKARLNDGKIDVCYVNKVSRLQFINMIGSYKKGTYLENKRIMRVATYHNCLSAYIDFESERSVCIDGEIHQMKELCIEIMPKMFRFALPEGSVYEGASFEEKELARV